MLNRLRALFRPMRLQTVPLAFEMYLDEMGHHLVRVYERIDQKRKPVREISKLFSYGYREEIQTPDSVIIRILREEDRQTLLALKSMNPVLHEDGALEFEI